MAASIVVMKCRGETCHPKNRTASAATCCLEIASQCIIVPICTESRLHFRATLGQEPEVEVGLV